MENSISRAPDFSNFTFWESGRTDAVFMSSKYLTRSLAPPSTSNGATSPAPPAGYTRQSFPSTESENRSERGASGEYSYTREAP